MMSVYALELQISDFQREVRSLFAELGAEIRTEQVKLQTRLSEALGKLDTGHVIVHKLREDVDGLMRGFEKLRVGREQAVA